jgi:hypothetical protein
MVARILMWEGPSPARRGLAEEEGSVPILAKQTPSAQRPDGGRRGTEAPPTLVLSPANVHRFESGKASDAESTALSVGCWALSVGR